MLPGLRVQSYHSFVRSQFRFGDSEFGIRRWGGISRLAGQKVCTASVQTSSHCHRKDRQGRKGYLGVSQAAWCSGGGNDNESGGYTESTALNWWKAWRSTPHSKNHNRATFPRENTNSKEGVQSSPRSNLRTSAVFRCKILPQASVQAGSLRSGGEIAGWE